MVQLSPLTQICGAISEQFRPVESSGWFHRLQVCSVDLQMTTMLKTGLSSNVQTDLCVRRLQRNVDLTEQFRPEVQRGPCMMAAWVWCIMDDRHLRLAAC